MLPTICMSIQNAKVRKRHNSDKINPIFFLKINQVIYYSVPVSSKLHRLISNSYQDILLTRKAWNMDKQMTQRNMPLQLLQSLGHKIIVITTWFWYLLSPFQILLISHIIQLSYTISLESHIDLHSMQNNLSIITKTLKCQVKFVADEILSVFCFYYYFWFSFFFFHRK